MFSALSNTNPIIGTSLNMSSANALNLGNAKTLSSGKELMFYKQRADLTRQCIDLINE